MKFQKALIFLFLIFQLVVCNFQSPSVNFVMFLFLVWIYFDSLMYRLLVLYYVTGYTFWDQ